jgi:hypothetical protein
MTIRIDGLPADLPPEDVVVLYSGAEQQPWDLAPLRMRPAALQTGDYTVAGCEHLVRIERKADDLPPCCGVDRDRFTREVERMPAFPVRIIICEMSWDAVRDGNWRSRISGDAVEASLLSWASQGIQVLMAPDRAAAQRWASRILYLVARRHYRQLRAMAGEMQRAEVRM